MTKGDILLPEYNIENILNSFQRKRVLVIGDLILDHYLSGSVDRVSPEAPVPIVLLNNRREKWVPGGAANVARNITALGGISLVAGVIGADDSGDKLKELLQTEGIEISAVAVDMEKPTTVKTRIMAKGQQLIRVDRESVEPISGSVMAEIIRRIETELNTVDCIVLADYNKGLLIPELIRFILDSADSRGIPVTVDPKFDNFFAFEGCTLFKPNRIETECGIGMKIRTLDDASKAGEELIMRTSAAAVLITLGEQGALLCRKGEEDYHMKAVTKHIYDVSGAGDTVIAVMALVLASESSLEEGVQIAGLAAAAACAEPGVYAVNCEDIHREVKRFTQSSNADSD